MIQNPAKEAPIHTYDDFLASVDRLSKFQPDAFRKNGGNIVRFNGWGSLLADNHRVVSINRHGLYRRSFDPLFAIG